MALTLVCNGLDRGSLAAARLSLHYNTQRVWNTLAILPVLPLEEEIYTLAELINLAQLDIFQMAIGLKTALRKNTRILGGIDLGILPRNVLIKVLDIIAETVAFLLFLLLHPLIHEAMNPCNIVIP